MQTKFLHRHSPPHIFTLVMITALGALSMNIFLPSLPSISEHFQQDIKVTQLAVTFFLFATAFLQPILGPLSDYYGRRPIAMLGLAGFFTGTIICIFAPYIEIFLLGRVIQAFSATGFVVSRAIIRDIVAREKAASMIGYVTMGMAVAPMIGPAIGGYLDEHYGWQAAFWLLLGFGFFVFVLIFLDQGETRKVAAKNVTSQFLTYPILLKSRRFWGYTLTSATASGTFFSILGGGPFVSERYFHLSPSQFGWHFALISLGYIVGNYISGRYTEKLGIAFMMIAGHSLVVLGGLISVFLLIDGSREALFFFMPMALLGVGNGVVLPGANAGIVSLHPHLAGAASGLAGFLQIMLGATLSVTAGWLVGAEFNPIPMIYLIIGISLVGVCSALFVIYIDRQEAQIQTASE